MGPIAHRLTKQVQVVCRILAKAASGLGLDDVPSRDLRHDRARRQRLLDNLHLLVARPAPPTLDAVENLNPHQPTLRLALKPYASSEAINATRWHSSDAFLPGAVRQKSSRVRHALSIEKVRMVKRRRSPNCRRQVTYFASRRCRCTTLHLTSDKVVPQNSRVLF